MAIVLKKLLPASSSRLMMVRYFKSIGSSYYPPEESRIIEVDYARNSKSIARRLLTGVYSFTDFVFPLWSPTKAMENFMNMIDIARWEVKESTDFLSMVRRVSGTTKEEADIKVNLQMDKAPRYLGHVIATSIVRKVRVLHVLDNPSATLIIQRKPHVETDENVFTYALKLPAGVFHTDATTIETMECGSLKITLTKLKAMRILSLSDHVEFAV